MNNKGLTFRRRQIKMNRAFLYELITWEFGIVVAILAAFVLVSSFGIRTAVVGSSMEPTLYNGQEILINRIAYQYGSPERNDVIVFRPNGNENSHYYVKRVIGLPGETIQIKQGAVYIDGLPYQNDVVEVTNDPGIAEAEIELGVDEYFVLGDNRENSEDSRSGNIGNVSVETIDGKAWYHMASGKIGMGLIE
ncbi:MAG TPA: signal peptidase I [Lachnospiraceae bacterium]|nr:signal peptidase I [Lachnospiraceae bacterium]